MSKNLALAYCAENQNTAQEIDRQLTLAAYHFKHFSCSKTTVETPISDLLSDYGDPVLLIISDNFLKSAQCMSRALKLMQKKGAQILAVVIDGEQIEQDGTTTFTPTNFDRVSDIIQYINYWQDQYLDLRRQKRQVDEADESSFNAHLKIMREISSEVGEFLRVLRNSNYMSWDDFAENYFESFFAFHQDTSGWELFQSLTSEQPESSDKLAIADEPTVELNDIPGIDLLQKAQSPSLVEKVTEIAEDTTQELVEKVAEIAEDTTQELVEEVTDSIEDTTQELVEEVTEIAEDTTQELVEEVTDNIEDTLQEKDSIERPILVSKKIKEVIEKSEQFFAAQQIEAGFSLLENALSETPSQIDLRYHYALSLAQLKDDYSAASSQLETILEIDPVNIDAHFLIGKLAEINENYDSALAHYEKTAQLNNEHKDIDYQLGMLLANHFPNRQQDAAKYLKKVTAAQPDNPEINYSYGLLLHEQLGKSKKATKYLKKTIEIDPEHPFAHYDLALIYHHLGKQSKAFAAYKRAVEINPELKTPENDEAFSLQEPLSVNEEPVQRALSPETIIKASLEADTFEALKQNIYRLEEMINAKGQREEEEKAALELAPRIPRREEIVFITGATSGIGRATAEKFAANGYKLILNGRRIDRLEALKKELKKAYNSDIILLPFDVRDADAVKATIESLEKKWENIDILINNAGKAKGFDPIHEGKLHHWEEMIDTNLKGLLYLTRTIAPTMVARKSGHIINICSTAGKEVYPKGNVYCATKFAVDALTKAMRIDLHPYNIRVSQVSPGHVEETEFAAVRFDGDTEKAKIYEDFLPLTAKDVAETLFFIANQPKHVNIQDVLLMGTQQASSLIVNRSGRDALDE